MEKYDVKKVVGQGSYGKAVLCRRKKDSSLCIIKQISVKQMSQKEAILTEQEATLLRRLQHPNIVSFWESFVKDGQLHIVMEFADGGDLDHYVKAHTKQRKSISESQVINMFVQLSLAIKHIHDRKILHRDLKSQNVFLTSSGQLKLGDFGVSRVLRHTMELAATQIGTPYYMSPEIMNNQRYNSKSDIWSLGIILYELICLRLPFDGRSMKELCQNIIRKNPAAPSSTYSRELRELLRDTLLKNPKTRPGINSILSRPIMRGKIDSLLGATRQQAEFSHTVLHGANVLSEKPPPPVSSASPMSAPAAVAPPPSPQPSRLKPPPVSKAPNPSPSAAVKHPPPLSSAAQAVARMQEKRAQQQQQYVNAMAGQMRKQIDDARKAEAERARAEHAREAEKQRRLREYALLKAKEQKQRELQQQQALARQREKEKQRQQLEREKVEQARKNIAEQKQKLLDQRRQQRQEYEANRKRGNVYGAAIPPDGAGAGIARQLPPRAAPRPSAAALPPPSLNPPIERRRYSEPVLAAAAGGVPQQSERDSGGDVVNPFLAIVGKQKYQAQAPQIRNIQQPSRSRSNISSGDSKPPWNPSCTIERSDDENDIDDNDNGEDVTLGKGPSSGNIPARAVPKEKKPPFVLQPKSNPKKPAGDKGDVSISIDDNPAVAVANTPWLSDLVGQMGQLKDDMKNLQDLRSPPKSKAAPPSFRDGYGDDPNHDKKMQPPTSLLVAEPGRISPQQLPASHIQAYSVAAIEDIHSPSKDVLKGRKENREKHKAGFRAFIQEAKQGSMLDNTINISISNNNNSSNKQQGYANHAAHPTRETEHAKIPVDQRPKKGPPKSSSSANEAGGFNLDQFRRQKEAERQDMKRIIQERRKNLIQAKSNAQIEDETPANVVIKSPSISEKAVQHSATNPHSEVSSHEDLLAFDMNDTACGHRFKVHRNQSVTSSEEVPSDDYTVLIEQMQEILQMPNAEVAIASKGNREDESELATSADELTSESQLEEDPDEFEEEEDVILGAVQQLAKEFDELDEEERQNDAKDHDYDDDDDEGSFDSTFEEDEAVGGAAPLDPFHSALLPNLLTADMHLLGPTTPADINNSNDKRKNNLDDNHGETSDNMNEDRKRHLRLVELQEYLEARLGARTVHKALNLLIEDSAGARNDADNDERDEFLLNKIEQIIGAHNLHYLDDMLMLLTLQ